MTSLGERGEKIHIWLITNITAVIIPKIKYVQHKPAKPFNINNSLAKSQILNRKPASVLQQGLILVTRVHICNSPAALIVQLLLLHTLLLKIITANIIASGRGTAIRSAAISLMSAFLPSV